MAAVVVAALALLLALGRSISLHRLHAKCYFQDAEGLRAGAEVRLAGVAVGSVTGVRARPEMRDHPAEVEMLIDTSHDLQIPDDAVVSLQTDGILGATFAEINISHTSGRPLANGGVLRTRETPPSSNLMECVSNIIEHRPCDSRGKTGDAKPGPAPVPAPR